MADNDWTKVAQAVIRLVAFGFAVIGFLLCSGDLYYLYSPRVDPARNIPPPRWGWVAVKSIPIFIALLLYWKSRALAERLTKDLD